MSLQNIAMTTMLIIQFSVVLQGAAERAVQTTKRILQQQDSFSVSLAYKATPVYVTECAPSQALMR